jgi:hypothetical protein
MCKKFRMEMLAPLLHRALKMDTEEPILMKFLKDRDEPNDKKSSTVSELPRRIPP